MELLHGEGYALTLARAYLSDRLLNIPNRRHAHFPSHTPYAWGWSDATFPQDAERGERGPPGNEKSWTLALMKRVGVQPGDVNRF